MSGLLSVEQVREILAQRDVPAGAFWDHVAGGDMTPVPAADLDRLIAEVVPRAEQRKQRTITLTGRAPVKVYEDEWPLIASATIRPGAMDHGTPVPDYQTDTFTLRVRRHGDGRTLVYGVIDAATAWTGTEDRRGGKLLAAGEDIAAAIEEVGADCGIPESVVRACVADLPAEET